MSNSIALGPVGLCSTCNNVSFCGFRSRRGFDALFCDMFDISPNGHGRKEGLSEFKSSAMEVMPYASSPANNLKGLCYNCDNSKSCMLYRDDGGVWHCEEYA